MFVLLTALAAPPSSSELFDQAVSLHRAGDASGADAKLEEARQALEGELKTAPTAALHAQLARLHDWAGDASKAEASAAAALKLDPTEETALRVLVASCSGRRDFACSLQFAERLAALVPEDQGVLFALGTAAHLRGKLGVAESTFAALFEANPTDTQALSKLIQVAQAGGESALVTKRIAQMRALKQAGHAPDFAKIGSFTRDQFEVDGRSVMVRQAFDLEGNRPVRYTFYIFGKAGLQGRISLGSYEKTTQVMRELGTLKAGQRAWHLDGYPKNGSHNTWGFFDGEPTYAQTKRRVIEVLGGNVKPTSSSQPN